MKNNIIRKIEKFIFPIFIIFVFLLAQFQPLASVDFFITDYFYSNLRTTNKDIVLICVDDQTLEEYGSFTSWSRAKTTELMDFLFQDENNAPLVVGVDFVFQGNGNNIEEDIALTNACTGIDRNIVMASSISFKGKVVNTEDGVKYNPYYVETIQYPYAGLRQVTKNGFTNAFLAEDATSRHSMNRVTYSNKYIESFAYVLASEYADAKGFDLPEVDVDENGLYRYFYAGKPGSFTHISLKTVLDGKVPNSEFRNKLVLFGSYAAGMQDSYFTTADVSSNMYGVEIQANIIQSLLDGSTAINADATLYAIALTLSVLLICVICYSLKYTILLFIPPVALISHAIIGRILSENGIIIPQLYAMIVYAIMFVYIIVRNLIAESLRRRQVVDVFSRYMDPTIVNSLTEKNALSTELVLGGTRRNVCVLFVDIRGFTTLSESMQPEDIVAILNQYFTLITNSIFNHHGMVDKFIGDACMAVFNAPLDVPDYAMEAVKTAVEFQQEAKKLTAELLEKYGKTVQFGVGINYGPAVIGNIGCNSRMDFTAIGDTVNTASRLEGAAGRGEVLISSYLYEEIKDRIVVEDGGKIPLKGKALPLQTYKVIEIKEQ